MGSYVYGGTFIVETVLLHDQIKGSKEHVFLGVDVTSLIEQPSKVSMN